ncbi:MULTISPECIES: O-antigen polymerase [unclassified Polynucleobacter]|uniref:O-antigen polymerase n=1 Tax=unclassified Polynucleobacter TaxID=2640945 RepID=UPI00257468E8|nr:MULTISPECIES: O-antigen polymerase [unclassified Polynucleobacter]BEI42150.1 hypothetical protein PHIN10_02990 [Polynucleobacter sp. HIN10]BEI43928.1 hypothetical protein PHIN11_03000 [Polynucleobacter sp. HIN11]
MKEHSLKVAVLLLLTIANILLLINPGNIDVFNFSNLIGAVTYILILFIIYKKIIKISYYSVMLIMVFTSYVFLTYIYQSTSLFFGSNDISEGINLFGGIYTVTSLSEALFISYLCGAILFILSLNEKKSLFYDVNKYKIKKHDLIILILLYAISIFSFLYGEVGYLGVLKDSNDKISPIGAIVMLYTPVLPALSIALLHGYKKNKYIKISFIILNIFLLIFISFVGRRVFIFSILTMVIYQFSVHYEHIDIRKTILNRAFFLYFFAIIASIILFAIIRQSLPDIGEGTSIYAVLEYISDTKNYSGDIVGNTNQRAFILSYLAVLINYAKDSIGFPFYGMEFYNSMITSVPSFLIDSKNSVSPEEYIHPLIGLNIFDGPNTIITAGYNDFGFIGSICYPILLCILYKFFDYIFNRNYKLIRIFIKLIFIYNLLNFEQDLSQFTFVKLRDLLFLLTIIYILYKTIFKIYKNEDIINR